MEQQESAQDEVQEEQVIMTIRISELNFCKPTSFPTKLLKLSRFNTTLSYDPLQSNFFSGTRAPLGHRGRGLAWRGGSRERPGREREVPWRCGAGSPART